MIAEGQKLPDFRLPDQDGESRTFDSLKGEKGLVLYVYPKDNTPGCTVEAQDFRDRLAAFQAAGFNVVGLSKDSAASHCKFIEKHGLNFPLLTDADGSFLEAIGGWGEKKMYGRTSVGIIRSTYIADADGTLTQVYRNVRAKGHAERVLKALS